MKTILLMALAVSFLYLAWAFIAFDLLWVINSGGVSRGVFVFALLCVLAAVEQ